MNNLKNIILSALPIALALSLTVHSESSSSLMGRVGVGISADDGFGIEPGTYLAAGAKQLRVSDANGNVTMFKGQLPNGVASPIELRIGDTLEYSGIIYLTLSEDPYKDEEHTLKEAALSPFRYNPLRSASFVQTGKGCRTVIENGCAFVYNDKDELCETRYSGYLSDISGYIINEAASEEDERGDPEVVSLREGVTYKVGTDIDAGEYEGTGSGTVRVYSADGHPKTVIKLSGGRTEGVESYIFEVAENEKIITDGRIVFTGR